MDGYQTNAADPEQLQFADRKVAQQARRRAELWRFILSESMGREWLFEVLLADLGYLQYIGGSPEEMYGTAALHNLCCRYLAEDIARHRDLYLQMQTEALKREETARRELAAARATWRANEGAHDDA